MSSPTSPWPMRLALALLLVVVALQVPATVASLRRPAPALPRWEHEVTAMREAEMRSTLDRLGSEGWELVSLRRVDASRDDRGSDWRVELVVKRQLLTSLRTE